MGRIKQTCLASQTTQLHVGIIWPAVLINVIGIPGQMANFFVVYVTIKNRKRLFNHCNYLLAMLSFFELLHQSGHLVALFVALTGLNFISYITSISFQLQAMFGLHASQLALTCIALDRLATTALPTLRLNKNLYLTSLTVPCFAIAFMRPAVTGHMSDLFNKGSINLLFSNLCLYTNVINVICYITIGALLRRNSGNRTNKNNRQIYKSLVVIMLLVLGGYLINILFGSFILNLLTFEGAQLWYMILWFCAVPAAISAASNGPVLYLFSKQYRYVFNQELRSFFCSTAFINKVNCTAAANLKPKMLPSCNPTSTNPFFNTH
uniref:Vomeronasal type-1 receptor n=1 Tax=Ditylenchus dipsaci TaxID=166011 RepID=A0A915DTS7_9BILA